MFENLPKEDKKVLFLEIVSKLNKALVKDEGTLRHCLYNEFDFDESIYFDAVDAGLLELLNSIQIKTDK